VFNVDQIGFTRRRFWASRGDPGDHVQIADVSNAATSTHGLPGEPRGLRVVQQQRQPVDPLWVTDGKPPGTALLADAAERGSRAICGIFSAGGQAFFLQPGSARPYGVVVWAGDGTINGNPSRLYDFSGGPARQPADQIALGKSDPLLRPIRPPAPSLRLRRPTADAPSRV